MIDPLSNKATEECLREILNNKNYNLSRKLKNGETGTDIIAKKGNNVFHIEVIGYKKSPPARAKDFYEAFFRAVSRLNEPDCKHCIIALPSRAEVGLPTRAKQYKKAWRRISKAFPELEIWLIDYSTKTYNRTFWGDWLK